jgi:hypothetical protein
MLDGYDYSAVGSEVDDVVDNAALNHLCRSYWGIHLIVDERQGLSEEAKK